MKMDRIFSTFVDEQITRSRISGYLAGAGYEKIAGQNELVFERGYMLGALTSSSIKKYKTVVKIETLTNADNSSQVHIVYDINTNGAIVSKKQIKVIEDEISDIIGSVNGFNAGISVNAKVEQQLVLEKRRREGANWFFWIAGLSIINTTVVMLGGSLNFVFGLGITQLVDGISLILIEELGTDATVLVWGIAFFIDLLIAGLFVLFGILARNNKWGYIIGMIFYTLDILIFLIIPDFLSIGFHLLALFGIFSGYKAFKQLEQQQAQPVVVQSVR